MALKNNDVVIGLIIWSVDLCCSNPHDFSHFIYEYINQPIKLTEPVTFYTKLGSPGACAGFFTGGGGRGSTMSKLDKQKKLHCSNMPSLLYPLRPPPPP